MSEGTAETWRAVVGYEGQYEVSDHGRVRSLDRVVVRRTRYGGLGTRRYAGRIRKPWPSDSYGHLLVRLLDADTARFVHQLVLEAFVGPKPFPGAMTRHLNGKPDDNRPSNLVWGTATENQRDRVRHGTDMKSLRSACCRGHLLQAPNLVTAPSSTREGHRRCLACARAHRRAHSVRITGRQADVTAIADALYAEIMTAAAGAAQGTLSAGVGTVSRRSRPSTPQRRPT